MDLLPKLEYHKARNHYVCVERERNDFRGNSKGYILSYSNDFLLMQAVTDFRIDGYAIIPIDTILRIRFNETDKYANKILQWEGENNKIEIRYRLNLNTWSEIFRSIKDTTHNVIVENEENEYFTIGPIKRIKENKVYIQYLNAAGFPEMPFDKIDYSEITIVKFNTRYIEIFSKYLSTKKC